MNNRDPLHGEAPEANKNDPQLLEILRLAAAAARKVKRPVSRHLLLLRVARLSLEKRYFDLVDGILSGIIVGMADLTPFEKALVHAECGYLKLSLGQADDAEKFFSQARNAALGMTDNLEQAGAFSKLVEVYCDLGQYGAAESLVEVMKAAPYRSAVLTVIARKYIEGNLPLEALRIAGRMCEPSVIIGEALLKIADSNSLLELRERAVQEVKKMLSGSV